MRALDRMSFKDSINRTNLPVHVAVIMDGNGRWAKQRGEHRITGHQNGVKSVREITEAAAEIGIKYLTLYAFSTENWNRPKEEVMALMQLLVSTIHGEVETLNKNDIRLIAIGDLKSLPDECFRELNAAMEATAGNKRMNLVLALSYSSRWEIIEGFRQMLKDIEKGKLKADQVSEKEFENYLCTAGIPEPELMIRTSGEHRISNFLLWQLSYAELYFTDKLWPDFGKEDFYEAIVDYQGRERRFGKTSEQLVSE